jgi:hypothetical protein
MLGHRDITFNFYQATVNATMKKVLFSQSFVKKAKTDQIIYFQEINPAGFFF